MPAGAGYRQSPIRPGQVGGLGGKRWRANRSGSIEQFDIGKYVGWIEISTKCLPEEAFQAGANHRACLASCGVALTDSNLTKTKAAIDYFKSNL